MLIVEYKLRVNQTQRAAIDEAIRTVQFIRNKCLRLWMDGRGISAFDLNVYSAQLAKEYPFAARLNSMARQASAERAAFQECSGCGERVQKSLSVRTHVCPRCGLVLDRDENAAINILQAALRTAGQTETGTRKGAKRLGRDGPLPAARRTGKPASMNQESHPL